MLTLRPRKKTISGGAPCIIPGFIAMHSYNL